MVFFFSANGTRPFASFSLSSYHDKCFKTLREREREKKKGPQQKPASPHKRPSNQGGNIYCASGSYDGVPKDLEWFNDEMV